MTLKLILMRHAKSAWDDPLVDDVDRKLNARGRRAAPLIAAWLVDNGHVPDVVVASSSARTLETWDRMAPAFPGTPKVTSTPKLYLAGPDLILGILQDQTAGSVLMICHNPGIAEAAARLASTPPAHPDFRRYPTAATTVFSFDQDDWREVSWHQAQVLDFAVPRDLG